MRPRWKELIQDTALASVLLVVDLRLFWDLGELPADAERGVITVVAAGVVGNLMLFWRRRAPVRMLCAITAYSLLVVALPVPGYYPMCGVWLALYTVAARRSGRHQWYALLIAALPLVPTLNHVLGAARHPNIQDTIGIPLFYLVLIGVVWGLGRWRRASQLQVEHLQARREAEARQAVTLERIRIARELHDIVAHSVTVMLLQAAGARRVLDVDPADAAVALDQIESVGSQAMEELRRMLRLLRAADGGEASPEPPAALADLEPLFTRIRAAGVPVTSTAEGERRELDPSVEQTAFLVVQEALTNVTKHGGAGARATVTLRWGPELRIEVVDDGRGVPNARIQHWPAGQGLVGLRERLTVAGGRLECGPHPAGGFRVAAWLPVSEPLPARRPVEVGAR